MIEENLDYYARRAREESAAAKASACPEAASAHRLLAIEYEAQVRALRGDGQPRVRLMRG